MCGGKGHLRFFHETKFLCRPQPESAARLCSTLCAPVADSGSATSFRPQTCSLCRRSWPLHLPPLSVPLAPRGQPQPLGHCSEPYSRRRQEPGRDPRCEPHAHLASRQVCHRPGASRRRVNLSVRVEDADGPLGESVAHETSEGRRHDSAHHTDEKGHLLPHTILGPNHTESPLGSQQGSVPRPHHGVALPHGCGCRAGGGVRCRLCRR